MAPPANNLFGLPRLLCAVAALGLIRGDGIAQTESAPTPEWWEAIRLNAQPVYTPLSLPDGMESKATYPNFDDNDRIYFGDGSLYRYDGTRWVSWESSIQGVYGLVSDHRIAVGNQFQIGYLQLDPSGNLVDSTPLWINGDFPLEAQGLPTWFAESFEKEPGVFWVRGSGTGRTAGRPSSWRVHSPTDRSFPSNGGDAGTIAFPMGSYGRSMQTWRSRLRFRATLQRTLFGFGTNRFVPVRIQI